MKTIPTIQQLYLLRLADLQTEFGVPLDPMGKAFLRAFAAVEAGMDKELYLHLGNIQKNVWPDTADPEASGGTLERFGRSKNLTQFQGSQGQYNVSVTGTASAVIKASTTFKSDDSSLNPGYLYVLDNAYTLTGSGDNITLRALTGGTKALLAIGNTLTCTEPIIGASPIVTVFGIGTSPVDAETTEEYRDVILETYTLEPKGGATADYRLWGRTVPGVKQIYPYATDGESNTVSTYVEAIIADSTDGKGTPSTTILDGVRAVYAPGNGLKPLGVMPVDVQPVTIQTVDITIPGTTASMTAAQKTLIQNALTEAVAKIRPFIPGDDVLANRSDVLSVNIIVSIILTAVPGSVFAAPTLTITPPAGGPVSYTTYLFDTGNIPFINSITFP